MIRLLADENIVGLDLLPRGELEICTINGRAIVAQDLSDFDALWVRSVTRVDAALIADNNLRFVGTATAGLEHVDQSVLADRGIEFAAAPGANANSVVEYVLAALAELGKPWELLEAGEKLGIVGYGAVGQQLAAFAHRMNWNMVIYDPWVAEKLPGDSSLPMVTLDTLLASRVISLHCSLHGSAPWPSRHLLNSKTLACLDSSQWLINAARGPVVDNRALLAHLASPSPVNCVLDVWEEEPAFDASLLSMPSLRIATPHIAGYSWDAKWQATKMLYDAMLREGLVTEVIVSAASDRGPLLPVSGAQVGAAATLIRQRYRIMDDDKNFRRLAQLPAGADRDEGFDQLRRCYPRRREVRGSVMAAGLGDLEPQMQRLLLALGVQRTWTQEQCRT